MSQTQDCTSTQAKAATLVEALPFIKRYTGKLVLIKVGGELLDNLSAAKSFVEDLILLRSVGIQIVLCHGGGPQISRTMTSLGLEPKFIDGLRVTDAQAMEVTSMVLVGKLNTKLVSLFNMHGEYAVGLNGVDGRLFMVKPQDPKLGFVGDVVQVNCSVVAQLAKSGVIPVIASVGLGSDGELYNINADVAAGQLAAALKAEKLVLITNVAGLYRDFSDPGTLINETNVKELQTILASPGVHTGMIPKLRSIVLALEAGVQSAHMIDGRLSHAVLLEIFTPQGVGTMIVRD